MSDERQPLRMGRPLRVSGEKPTRQKIFDAALDLFAEYGYDRTSMRRIAGAVGLTESAVYRHYPGKEAILDAIFSYAESAVFSPLPEPPEDEQTSSIFRSLLSAPVDSISADPRLVKIMRIMYAEMHHNEKIRRYYRKEYVQRADDLLEALFAEEMRNGRMRECSPRALAMVFNALRSEWAFRTFILKHGESDRMDSLEEGMDIPLQFFESLLTPGTVARERGTTIRKEKQRSVTRGRKNQKRDTRGSAGIHRPKGRPADR